MSLAARGWAWRSPSPPSAHSSARPSAAPFSGTTTPGGSPPCSLAYALSSPPLCHSPVLTTARVGRRVRRLCVPGAGLRGAVQKGQTAASPPLSFLGVNLNGHAFTLLDLGYHYDCFTTAQMCFVLLEI